ncbi:MAG: antitoxin AF2212-like protein [Candidatus Jordarchaeum sp.]|uniref:antitoxin AF2212-like protein n=1 Tax=Candidatus Jordarchaeum sp. TaxID=2823881 RepID=UPI00404ACB04
MFKPVERVDLPEGVKVRIVVKPSINALMKELEKVELKGDLDEVFKGEKRKNIMNNDVVLDTTFNGN